MVTAKSQIGQRHRSALLLSAAVALIAGATLIGSGTPAQAAGLCSSVSSGSVSSATISVTPCTGLSDADDVHITGSGFTASQGVTIIMCNAAPTSTNDCDSSGGASGSADADGSGNIDETFTVAQSFTTEGGTDISCNNGSPSPNCSILVTSGIPTQDTGAYEDVGFGAPASTTTTAAGSTTTTGGGSTTTTKGSTTSTTSAAATCPTGTATSGPSVTVSPLQATPGSDVTVTASGFPAGIPVNINLCSTPVLLKTAVIDASGNLVATVVSIPATAALGTHQVVVQAATGSTPIGVGSLTLVAGNVTASPVATATEATPTFTG